MLSGKTVRATQIFFCLDRCVRIWMCFSRYVLQNAGKRLSSRSQISAVLSEWIALVSVTCSMGRAVFYIGLQYMGLEAAEQCRRTIPGCYAHGLVQLRNEWGGLLSMVGSLPVNSCPTLLCNAAGFCASVWIVSAVLAEVRRGSSVPGRIGYARWPASFLFWKMVVGDRFRVDGRAPMGISEAGGRTGWVP